MIFDLNYKFRDFSGGPVVKNPPCNNAEDAGFIPGWRARILYATRQLSPCMATTELDSSGGCTPHSRARTAQQQVLYYTRKIPSVTMTAQCSQIHKYFKNKLQG